MKAVIQLDKTTYTTFSEWRAAVGKWLNRLRFKTEWKKYQDDEYSYSVYMARIHCMVNDIRKALGNDPYSREKFNDACQYRNILSENYQIAYDEIINIIFGWW